MGITLGVALVALIMMGVEAVKPGRQWPQVRGWWARALFLNGVQVIVVLMAGMMWDRWMQGVSLFQGQRLGSVWGGIVGYGAITFIYYWWHRVRHSSPFLWRIFHQLHHSPARLEIITSFYKHPLEILANSLLSSSIIYLLLGLDVSTAAVVTLVTGLAELYYHWNVATPHWTGYFFQRPEMHCVHHELGSHHYNYSDLPLWDILFGTFKNPRETAFECGFGGDHEQRLAEMLKGQDILLPEVGNL